MSPRTSAPFRADMVGSLLRTKPLKEAREKFSKGEITKAALTAVEDKEVSDSIKKQESIGLTVTVNTPARARITPPESVSCCCAFPASSSGQKKAPA